MKILRPKIKTVLATLALGVAMATAQQWGDSPRDEQQWWNPGDWYDRTPDTWETWDYDYNWNDFDWYEDGGVGGAYDSLDLDEGYDTSDIYDRDADLYDDWPDYEWYDDFNYDP